MIVNLNLTLDRINSIFFMIVNFNSKLDGINSIFFIYWVKNKKGMKLNHLSEYINFMYWNFS